MRLLDLFCGAGGAGMGYHRAGFEVVGVDSKPQKHYPFEFHCADAFACLEKHGQEFDVIHASPPCQAFTSAKTLQGRAHHDLLTPMRAALETLDRPWVIENVPFSPMQNYITLCGSHFGLPNLIRHRWFETRDSLFALLPPCKHPLEVVSVFGHGGKNKYFPMDRWRASMGIDWMSRNELAQAIPPAYTEWIGRRLLEALQPPR